MDAVNPDYMVVRLLYSGSKIPVWVLPGTMLFGLFPVIGQIYHGALPYYVGLPAYALFGTGIVGIRLANLLFGLIVIAAAGGFLRAFRVYPIIGSVCLAALAVDPGFLFSFRTQFYITLLPLAFLLTSIALIECRKSRLTSWISVAAGFLAGASVYGYFIYAFLLPAAALHAFWRSCGAPYQRRLAFRWLVGLVLGVTPYLLGMLLILRATGGVRGFLHFIVHNLNELGAASSPMPLVERVSYFGTMVSWTLQDVGPASMMLHGTLPITFPGIKFALLLAVPALGLIVSLILRPRFSGLVVLASMFVGMFTLVLFFGNRLWLHHAALLLPVAYIALALTMDLFLALFAAKFGWLPSAGASALVLPLLVGNVVDRQAIFSELQRTGGVGLSSDAIPRFAEESLQSGALTHAFFPDWGVFMPFAMVTHGAIQITTGFAPEDAFRTLCDGKDALLALMDGQGPDRLPDWIKEVGWGQPDITIYRQRDGNPVLTAIRWRALTVDHPLCPK